MIEPSRRHGYFDPRFSTQRAGTDRPTANGTTGIDGLQGGLLPRADGRAGDARSRRSRVSASRGDRNSHVDRRGQRLLLHCARRSG